jgi:hypothetical protein
VDFFLAVPSADWLNFQGEQAAPAGTIRGRSTTPRHRKQNGRGRGVRHCTPSPRCLLGRPKQRTNQPHREWKFLLLEQKRRLSIPLSLWDLEREGDPGMCLPSIDTAQNCEREGYSLLHPHMHQQSMLQKPAAAVSDLCGR